MADVYLFIDLLNVHAQPNNEDNGGWVEAAQGSHIERTYGYNVSY